MVLKTMKYCKPASIHEAIEIYFALRDERKQPIYYSGGTEIITFGRLNLVDSGVIIDIKGIKECMSFGFFENYLISGAGLPLTFIEDKNLFPLLSKTSSGIADRTARNKITLGGNICGLILYREAVLPFLLTDSQVIVAGKNGVQTVSIHNIFQQVLRLEEGQFLVQMITEKSYIDLPFISIKRRQQWETGYPLTTIASIKKDNQLRFAFSGLCAFPFRSEEMEKELNNTRLSFDKRIDQAIKGIPGPVLNDIEGSKEYRLFVLRNTLTDILSEMEGY